MAKKFSANAKLLLTGEYLVLNGAKSLALPLKYSQEMMITYSESPQKQSTFLWESTDTNGTWFFAELLRENLQIVKTNDNQVAEKLVQILTTASQISNTKYQFTKNLSLVRTSLNFDRNWGLGSSSTLLSNIAQWTGANPYELLEKTFGGSGYDIACATSQGPIVYTKVPKRKIETVNWIPSYKNQLWLIYFGKKQDTAISLVNYKNIVPSKDDIKRISKITEEISLVDNVSDFGKLIEEHEQILSNTLNLKTLKQQHFSSFKGYIKSLGAWGGDFFLAASPENEEYVKKYFALKGYNTIFPFEKMVKFY